MERLAGNEARVTRAWAGRKVVCIGGGPSLTQEDLARIKRAREADAVRVIVVNDQYLVAPWADLLYFADFRWYDWRTGGSEEKSWPWVSFTGAEVKRAFDEFAGEKVTIRKFHNPELGGEPDYPASIARLANLGPEGLSEKPEALYTGKNGGFQAMQVAVLAGAAAVPLVAYDMQFAGQRTHSHNGHRERTAEGAYKSDYYRYFHVVEHQLKAMGVRVVNCTPGSRIRCFPMSTIEQELGAAA